MQKHQYGLVPAVLGLLKKLTPCKLGAEQQRDVNLHVLRSPEKKGGHIMATHPCCLRALNMRKKQYSYITLTATASPKYHLHTIASTKKQWLVVCLGPSCTLRAEHYYLEVQST